MKEDQRMRKLFVLTAVVALVASFSFGSVAYAGGLTAPTVVCTTDVGNSELDISWTVPATTAPPPPIDVEKYGVDIVCINPDTSEFGLDMGTSDVRDDCTFFGLTAGCAFDLTSFSLPFSELTGAVSGAVCTVFVKGVHKKRSNSVKGHNKDTIHLVGSVLCSAPLP
jgi:hypothetical protein